MKTQKGFTLLIAIIIAATLLLVSTGIVSLVVKEAFLASAAEESQQAFYAADTGVECALYWDLKNTSGSAFDQGTPIKCNQDSSNSTNPIPNIGRNDGTPFTITFAPQPFCAIVSVLKGGGKTTITSRGYNTCDDANPRRVERGVKVSY